MVLSKTLQLKHRFPKTRDEYLEYRAVSILSRKFANRISIIHNPPANIVESMRTIAQQHHSRLEAEQILQKYQSSITIAIREILNAFWSIFKMESSIRIFCKYASANTYLYHIPCLQLLADCPLTYDIYFSAVEMQCQFIDAVKNMTQRLLNLYLDSGLYRIPIPIPYEKVVYFAKCNNVSLVRTKTLYKNLREMAMHHRIKRQINNISRIGCAKIILYYLPMIKDKQFPHDLFDYIETVLMELIAGLDADAVVQIDIAEMREKLHIIWNELHQYIDESIAATNGNITAINRIRATVGVVPLLILRLTYMINE